MNANFARRATLNIRITFSANEFQSDRTVDGKLAVECAFQLCMRGTAGHSAGCESNRCQPCSLVSSFHFSWFPRTEQQVRRAILPIKLYENAQLEVPCIAIARTETANEAGGAHGSFNFEQGIERTLPVSFQIDRHHREAGLLYTGKDLASHRGF